MSDTSKVYPPTVILRAIRDVGAYKKGELLSCGDAISQRIASNGELIDFDLSDWDVVIQQYRKDGVKLIKSTSTQLPEIEGLAEALETRIERHTDMETFLRHSRIIQEAAQAYHKLMGESK